VTGKRTGKKLRKTSKEVRHHPAHVSAPLFRTVRVCQGACLVTPTLNGIDGSARWISQGRKKRGKRGFFWLSDS